MKNDSRIILTFDEFFKICSKTFFEEEGFRVETELEIFKLPKRLDLLVVKSPEKGIPEDFTLFRYWKENNLISFKSKPDALELSDIYDSHIYFYGYLNMTRTASFENTTMNLLVNSHPRAFLKKYSAFCKEVEPGVWEIDSNFYKVYLIEIHKINFEGIDRMYLGNFSTDAVFYKLLNLMENYHDTKNANWIDKLKMIIQDRIVAFEKDPKIRRKYMATAYESDITNLVKPHLDKAREEGNQEGKLESARLMKNKGYPISDILEITGLSEKVLKENGVL
jgi:hypothetical protein